MTSLDDDVMEELLAGEGLRPRDNSPSFQVCVFSMESPLCTVTAFGEWDSRAEGSSRNQQRLVAAQAAVLWDVGLTHACPRSR